MGSGRLAILRDFAGYTTGHGPANIVRSRSWPIKILWGVALLLAWIILTWQVCLGILKYFQYPVQVKVKLQNEALPFPAVTVCNLNPAKLGKLDQEIVKNLSTTMGPGFNENWDTLGENWKNVIPQFYRQLFGLTNHLFNAQKNLSEVGHQIETMLVDCSFHSSMCLPQNFTGWDHPVYGRCYTLVVDSDAFSSSSGPLFGLSLTLFAEDGQYLNFTAATGFRVEIHPPEYPPFPEHHGFSISPGFLTSVSLKYRKIRRLPRPYDNTDCSSELLAKDKSPNAFGEKWTAVLSQTSGKHPTVNYTHSACEKACMIKQIFEECSCAVSSQVTRDLAELFWPDTNASACSGFQDTSCMKKVLESKEKHCSSCKQPCHQADYVQVPAVSDWPRTDYLKMMLPIWKKRSATIAFNESQRDLARNSMAALQIYFQELNYEAITEEAAIGVVDMLSAVGGTFGLYAGISVLTLLEFLELLCRLIFNRPSPSPQGRPSASKVRPKKHPLAILK